MNKIKVNTGIVSLVLLACLFSGWQTMLIVSILLFLFCEVDEKTKQIAIRVITFYVGITLIGLAWDLIEGGVGLILDTIQKVLDLINYYRRSLDILTIAKVSTPIITVLGIGSSIITYLILLTKFFFILAVLAGKEPKENPFSKQVNNFVSKAVNFINNLNLNITQGPVNPQQGPQPQPNFGPEQQPNYGPQPGPNNYPQQ